MDATGDVFSFIIIARLQLIRLSARLKMYEQTGEPAKDEFGHIW